MWLMQWKEQNGLLVPKQLDADFAQKKHMAEHANDELMIFLAE